MSDGGNAGSASSPFEALRRHALAHKIDVTLWMTRILTMLFTFSYFLPIFGNPYSAYYKALVANAATSALRLHQRQPRMTLSREFIAAVLLEDSCHYLFYSMIFLYVTPVTLALLPVFLFSLIHFASYSLTLLDTLGQNSWWGARLLISLIELQSRNILRFIACSEILLMPFTLVLIFMGRAGLLTPCIYYHFLVKRYQSHRNPYTRNMFHEMRLALEGVAQKSVTPNFIRSAIRSFIPFVSRLAPNQPSAQ